MCGTVAAEPYRTPAPREQAPSPPRDEAAALGSLRSTHGPAKAARSPLTIPLVIAICLLPAVVLITRAPDGETPLLGLLGAPMIAVLIAWVVRSGRPADSVDLHQHGVVVHGRGGTRDVVLFEDVDALWIEHRWVRGWMSEFALISAVRLVLHDGTSHRVPGEVERGAELMRWIFRHCSDPLLPDARAALAAGETLTFGKAQLDGEGVTIRGARARWDEIRLVRASLGKLALFRRMPIFAWRTVEMDSIPHPTIFGRLVVERAKRVERDYPPGFEES
jgi:hypothetical protein